VSAPVVAIVGRPNVGKSTLFNRLVGEMKAAVHDRPGVTRDRLYESADLLGREVLVVDTGGIEPDEGTDLYAAMRAQTLVAVDEASVIVLLVDGRAGHTPTDDAVVDLLRRSGKPVVMAVNKIDGERHEDLVADFWGLGIHDVIGVSAAHGRGVYDLMERVVAVLPPQADAAPETDLTDAPADDMPDEIRIAVLGRPNVGKSTLVNRLLGAPRQVVDDRPGTTMDAVDTPLVVGDRRYVLVDTAGVRRRARIDDALERYVTLRSIRAIERCHVTLLVLDATEGPTEQDARLATLVEERGRGLVVLVNKWDKARGSDDIDARSAEDALREAMPHVAWAPHLFVSAKSGKGCHRILAVVDDVFRAACVRVPTPAFNRWLERTVSSHTPPQRYHHPVRIYYGAQSRVRPPTFTLHANTPEGVDVGYLRFLEGRLRAEYGFHGTPVRLQVRKRRGLGEG
jgi:GTP-binding protein